jgi:transcriptional regulator
MYRKDLIPMLLRQPRSVAELAQLLDEAPKDVEEDLQHLLKSLKRTPYRAVIEPAACRQCGFEFHHDKLRKPGKCPQCKGTWISEPRIGIEEK